jgi:RNA polymerase sigma factor (sigma-70 family)
VASVIGSAILRTQTDERLVALARAGHKRAFEAIAERYRAELTRALRRILPTSSVEDALQQTLLQAWQALSAGTEVRELRAWLHRIARNAAIAASSRGYDYDELKDALLISPGPDEDLERREAVRRALRGIAELPERQRDALLAVAVDGRSHAQVGMDLGITDTAARQLVRRARVSLLSVMSVAVPPPLVGWAARAGHSVVGGSSAAGKAAAGKAAGTGIGGGLGGSALKVGAIVVTVGGVAAGVPPIRHVIVPPTPSHTAHHAARRSSHEPTYVAAALVTPTGRSAATSRSSAVGGSSPSRERSRAHRTRTPVQAGSGTTPAVVPAGTPASAPGAATTTTAATATPASGTSPGAAATAAFWVWWLAHEAEHKQGAGSTTSVTGRSTGSAGTQGGVSPSGQSGTSGGSSADCGTTPASGAPASGQSGQTGSSADPAGSSATATAGQAGSTAASGQSGGSSAASGTGRTAFGSPGGRRSPTGSTSTTSTPVTGTPNCGASTTRAFAPAGDSTAPVQGQGTG